MSIRLRNHPDDMTETERVLYLRVDITCYGKFKCIFSINLSFGSFLECLPSGLSCRRTSNNIFLCSLDGFKLVSLQSEKKM